MKALKVIVLLLGALTCSNKILAYANIATFPKSLKQTYEDGSYTKMQCERLRNSKEPNESCVFTIATKRHLKKSYAFSVSNYGYSHSSALHGYSYWPSGDGVAFDVPCLEKDYEELSEYKDKKLSDADLSNVNCFLFLYPEGNQLRADHVEISFYNNASGRDYHESREL